MPNKPSPVSRPMLRLADGQTDTKPAKGFQRVAARIAKPLKGLGVWGGGRLAPPPAADRPISAEDLAQIDRFSAKMTASSKVDRVFDPGRLKIRNMKEELLKLKELAQKIENNLDELGAHLKSIPQSDTVGAIEVKLKIMKNEDLAKHTHNALQELCGNLHQAIDVECTKLQKTIDFLKQKMPQEDALGQHPIRQEIETAKNELLEFAFDKATWQV